MTYAWCAIRGCDNRATAIPSPVALCPAHTSILTAQLTPPWAQTVYYAGWLDHDIIKIGTSTRVISRLQSLSAGPRGRIYLLAAEPGSYDRERQRHRQHQASRHPGTELFTLTPALVNHMRNLHRNHPGWPVLSGAGDSWVWSL